MCALLAATASTTISSIHHFPCVQHAEKAGDDSWEVPPVPIPNTEVKLPGADGTAEEARWESRLSPARLSRFALCEAAFLFWRSLFLEGLGLYTAGR